MTDNSNDIAISAGKLTILNPIQNYIINFHNNTEVVGKLDFNGPKMVFTGNADESVDAFVRAFVHWFDKRLKQERESEREACAKVVEPSAEHRRDALRDYIGGAEGVELLDAAAAAIRARNET